MVQGAGSTGALTDLPTVFGLVIMTSMSVCVSVYIYMYIWEFPKIGGYLSWGSL